MNLDLPIQMVVFGSMLGLGFVYLVLSALVSSFFDGDDSDGHDFDGDATEPTVSLFSPKVAAIFLVGFGAGGVIATSYDADAIVSTLIALGSGGLTGIAGIFFLKAIYRQQASSEISKQDAIGCFGSVTLAVPVNGTGHVEVSVRGSLNTYICRSFGESIPVGSRVRVVSVEGGHLIVEIPQTVKAVSP